MTIDEINNGQDNALSELRSRIQARRASVEAKMPPYEPLRRKMVEVSELITEPSENGEFCLQRYSELAENLDLHYHNYLTALEELKEDTTKATSQWEYEKQLKLVAQELEKLLDEGMKVRFS